MKLNFRTYLVLGITLALVMLFIIFFVVEKEHVSEIELLEDVQFVLNNPDDIKKYSVNGEVEHLLATETQHHWDLQIPNSNKSASLTVVLRKFDHGDIILFTKLDNPSEEEMNINYSIQLSEMMNKEEWIYPNDDFEREHDPTLGVDPTSYPVGLKSLHDQNGHRLDVFSGKNYISRELVHNYENGGESKLRELIDEIDGYKWGKGAETKRLSYELLSKGNDRSEHWIMFSEEKLFQEKNNLTKWMDYSLENYKQVNKWYTADGPYRKLPWSIEPFTELGYGRNLGTMREKVVMDNYKSTEEQYFYTIVMNSLVDLLNYRDEEEEVWKTEYTSTWLKSQWGTTAPFIDTRHNENIALFFMDTAEHFNKMELMSYASNYGRLLNRQLKEENIIELGQNHFYIADYEGIFEGETTHASLNHILGEMNYLLNWYIHSEDDESLKLAMDLKKAVEFAGEDWVRENGDLWYQINPDLSFEGNDYPLLTLEDLLFAQNNLAKLNIQQSPVFFDLINTKAKYAIDQNIHLDKHIINLLEEQGHRDVLEYINNKY